MGLRGLRREGFAAIDNCVSRGPRASHRRWDTGRAATTVPKPDGVCFARQLFRGGSSLGGPCLMRSVH